MSVRRSSPYLRRLVASKEQYLLSPYSPHSWWHEHGRLSMVRRLEAKGFPNLWGWLFVTVTVVPDDYDSPVEAYEKGADRVRRMVANLRANGYPIRRYFSKLELHESGFPHWHLGLDCREFIPNDDVSDAWGLGFTKTKRVTKARDFKYLWKYVVKGNEEIPDWVLDYPRRIRVFQTSVGFFAEPQSSSKSGDAAGEPEVRTLRVKFSEWSERGVVRMRESNYRGVPVKLAAHYVDIFIRRVESGARALDAYHVSLHLDSIEEYIQPWIPKPKRPRRPSAPAKTSTWERCPTAPISSDDVPSRLSDANIRRITSLA